MARFPKIQSPCPYKRDLAAVMDGDFCRMCQRNVIDLTAMDDAGRVAFLAGCEQEVCVSYRLRPALAAAALAAAAIAVPAYAQDVPAVPASAVAADADLAEGEYLDNIFVGGITDPRHVEFVEEAADSAMPDLPVTYEDPAPSPAEPVKPAP